MNALMKAVAAVAVSCSALFASAKDGVADKWAIIGGAINNTQYNWYEVDENGEPVDGGWILKVAWDSTLERISINGSVVQVGTAGILDFSKTDLVGITADNNNSFKGKTFITEVRFPAKVEVIAASAFSGCTGLTKVDFGGEGSALYKIGGSAFYNCTSLTTVTPLLPKKVRQLGSSAFQNCPVTGDLRIGYEAAYPFEIGERAFQNKHQLSSVDIGPQVTKLYNHVFSSTAENTTLKSVKLSEGLTYIGTEAFYNCKAIASVENPMPSTLTSVYAAWRNSSIPGTVRYDLPQLYNERLFENCKSLERIVFGTRFNGLFNYIRTFNGSTLKYIDFEGDAVPSFTSGSTFSGRGNYTLLVTVPGDSATWAAVLADSAQVTPWNALDPAVQANFTANFPDDPEPLGLIIANWGTQKNNPNTLVNQWITTDTKGVYAQLAGAGQVKVKLDTSKLSSANLAVRITRAAGQATETALATGVTSSDWATYNLPSLAANATYQVELLVSKGDGTPYAAVDLGGIYTGAVSISSIGSLEAANDGAATVTVTRGTSDAATALPLTVNLDLSGTAVADTDYVAFTPSVTIPAGASEATVVIKPLFNSSATADRTLVITLGDGGYAAGGSASVTIPSVKPVWGWTLDTTAKTLTERVANGTAWVIPVDISGYNLTLKVPTTVGTSTVLDFRTVIATAAGVQYKIVSNSDSAFKNKTTITELYLPESMTTVYNSFCHGCTSLTKVRLSSQLVKIGGSAFNNCYNLREVTPFLPDTLQTLEGSAFYNCYRLTTPLSYGFGLTPTGDPLPISVGGQVFKQCKAIPSAEIGSGVTGLGSETFQTCEGLKAVSLPTNLVTIGDNCFYGCLSLESVTPFLPDTLVYLGCQSFYNCKQLAGELKAGQSGKLVAASSNLSMFGNSLVSSAEIQNMATVPKAFFRDMKSLTSVTFDETPTVFGDEVFQNDSGLTEIALPSGLTSIGANCFRECTSLVTLTPFLPAGVNYIGSYCFYNCKELEGELRFALGLDAASFGGSANFGYCSKITKAFLGDAIAAIPSDCFSGCSSLTYAKLPEGLTSMSGTSVFSGCSSLTTIEPLLPAGVTGTIGSSYFNGAPVEGELYIATNGLALTLGSNAFKGVRVSKVVFGDNVTSIGSDCFYGCNRIESLVLPKNLEKFDGSSIFSGCTALKEVENLFPLTLTKLDSSAFRGCSALNQPAVLWPAAAMAAGGTTFCNMGANGITELDLGANVTSLGGQFLEWTMSVKRIVIRNSSMTWSSNSFNNWNDYQCAFVVHRDQATWNGAALSGVLTPWDDLSEDIQKKYLDAYPGEPEPRGVIADAKYPKRQWVVSYGIVTPGVKSLTINGFPKQYASKSVTPTYGGHKNIAVPLSVSAARYAPDGNVLYGCAGYVIEDSGDFGWENPVTNLFADADARTVSYTADADGDKRLSWLWEPAAYSIAVIQPTDPTIGSATVSQGSLEGYFKIGETATITAVDGTGTFVQWHGDVPEGHETDRTLEVLIDGPKNITPEFSSPWTFDAAKNTLSDGFWTLNATRSGKAGAYTYTVGKPVTVYELGVLDLTKAVAGEGGTITSIAIDAFKGNTSLTEVRLPSTLTRINASAFYGCVNLKTVTPFLPASVNWIGQRAFYGCSALECELVLAKDGGDITWDGGPHFNESAVTKVTFGPEVRKVGGNCFQNCKKLKAVVLNEVMTNIASECFWGCSALESVEPLLPAALTYLAQGAFYGCANLRGVVYIGTNGVEVTLQSSGYGPFQGSGVDEIHLGEGVTKIPTNFTRDSPNLTTVTMSENVTSLGNCAFTGCPKLTSVTPVFPAAVTTVGNELYYNCPKLKGDVAIGTNGVEVTLNSGNYGPLRLTGITSLYIGPGLHLLRDDGFATDCASLTNVVFADGGVTNIGNFSFRNCTALKNVKLPKELFRVGVEAFLSCSSLKTVTPFLPNAVGQIERYAFSKCSALATPLVLEAKKRGGVRQTIDLTNHSNGNQFSSCSKVPSITINEISPLINSTFSSMTGVKEVYLKGAAPLVIGGTSNNFELWGGRQSRWHVPKTGWEAWLAANVKRWDDVSQEDKEHYFLDDFPGETKPAYGQLVNSYQKAGVQWVVLWNPNPQGTTLIMR